MKKILLTIACIFALSIAVTAQQTVFDGADTITAGVTLTSEAFKVADYPVMIWPTFQEYYDHLSGKTKINTVAWASLDGVKWDTIPRFYYQNTTYADLTVINSTNEMEEPIFLKYLKVTMAGVDSTQSVIPHAVWWYKKAP